MAIEIIMPKAGIDMEEGQIVEWKKKVGDKINKDDVILEIMTDKTSMEIQSENEGYLLGTLYNDGDTVPVTTIIGYMGEQGEAMPTGGNEPKKEEAPAPKVEEKVVSSPSVEIKAPQYGKVINTEVRATPAARLLAKKLNISLNLVQGTGIFGRIHKDDVENYDKLYSIKISPLAKAIALEHNIDLNEVVGTGFMGKIMREDIMKLINKPEVKEEVKVQEEKPKAETKATVEAEDDVEIIPMTAMRKVIAKRMVESYTTAPVFALNYEVDMTEIIALRKKLLQPILDKTGKKVTITDIISLAVIKTLMKHKYVNSRLSEDGKNIICHKYVNLAMAVGFEGGLLTPVVKGADKMSLSDLVVNLKNVTKKALEMKLTPDELAGSTFTISNLGMFGVTSFNPIINQPNSAILGVSSTVEKPVVKDGQIVVRPMMMMTLTIDHRVVDGMAGAQFMQDLKSLLEDPITMLI